MDFTDHDQFLAAIDGKPFVLNGVHGVLTVLRTKFMHRATDEGRESPEYRATKRKLGDDYTTEMDMCEMSDERWADISKQLDVHLVCS